MEYTLTYIMLENSDEMKWIAESSLLSELRLTLFSISM